MASYGYERAPDILAKFGSVIAGSAIIGSTIVASSPIQPTDNLLIFLASYLQTAITTASGLFFLQRGGLPIKQILASVGGETIKCVRTGCERVTSAVANEMSNMFKFGVDALGIYLTSEYTDLTFDADDMSIKSSISSRIASSASSVSSVSSASSAFSSASSAFSSASSASSAKEAIDAILNVSENVQPEILFYEMSMEGMEIDVDSQRPISPITNSQGSQGSQLSQGSQGSQPSQGSQELSFGSLYKDLSTTPDVVSPSGSQGSQEPIGGRKSRRHMKSKRSRKGIKRRKGRITKKRKGHYRTLKRYKYKSKMRR